MLKLLILILTISQITEPSSYDRIINGKSISIEEAPYQVSLHEIGQHICGGSIINKNWVLTAAHCVENHKILLYSIRAGSSEHNRGGSLHQIDEIVRHEKYGSIHDHPVHDIALLRIWDPFIFDDTRKPIGLFRNGEQIPKNVFAVISGWGQTTHGIPNILQIAHVPMIKKSLCHKKYENEGGINEKQICAAYEDGGIDACYGDSGGPLIINHRLAGIVSWAIDCASADYPGVYTEVAGYQSWIIDVIMGLR